MTIPIGESPAQHSPLILMVQKMNMRPMRLTCASTVSDSFQGAQGFPELFFCACRCEVWQADVCFFLLGPTVKFVCGCCCCDVVVAAVARTDGIDNTVVR